MLSTRKQIFGVTPGGPGLNVRWLPHWHKMKIRPPQSNCTCLQALFDTDVAQIWACISNARRESQLTNSQRIIWCVFEQRSRTMSSPLPINSSYQLTTSVCWRDTGRVQRGLAGLSAALRCANVKECQCQWETDMGSAGGWWAEWRSMRSTPKVAETPTHCLCTVMLFQNTYGYYLVEIWSKYDLVVLLRSCVYRACDKCQKRTVKY